MSRGACLGLGLILLLAAPAAAEPFKFIRIGDVDGFGFENPQALARASRLGPAPRADTNGDGVLSPGEFLPDLNRDGVVAVFSNDNFDNRDANEIRDVNNACAGCKKIGIQTRGSNWTDLAISASQAGRHWPDADGPVTPNNATFVFDFVVDKDQIAPGGTLFFNLVFGDYDIDPAIVQVAFANGKVRNLPLRNLRDGPFDNSRDGLIDAATAHLSFEDVFTRNEAGDWHGFVTVVFVAPFEPYTTFDYVEISIFQIA